MKKRSKKYLEKLNIVDRNKLYAKEEAIALVKKTSNSNFDTTVDVALRLNVDVKKSDQLLRGAMVLPHGSGQTQTILVLATGEQAAQAQVAGADFVGEKELIAKIQQENWFAYDIIVATPEMMPALSKLGKILGPKGLMPNAKTGTVTTDVAKVVTEIKKGRIEYRTDNYGIIHTIIGKSSFTDQQLLENLIFLIKSVIKIKPASVKGVYLRSLIISSTMGPGIKVDLNSFDK